MTTGSKHKMELISLAPGFSQVIFGRTMAENRLNAFRIGVGIPAT
jgi:hypothetical protein